MIQGLLLTQEAFAIGSISTIFLGHAKTFCHRGITSTLRAPQRSGYGSLFGVKKLHDLPQPAKPGARALLQTNQ